MSGKSSKEFKLTLYADFEILSQGEPGVSGFMHNEHALNSMASAPASTILAANPNYAPGAAATRAPLTEHEIKIGKAVTSKEEGGKEMEIFTMTLGHETISLLPLKNWCQLDVYKWCVRGKLPGTPAGLEIAFDHIKVAGEIVSPRDSDACQRLENIFNEWLALEKATLEQARNKTHPKSTPAPLSTALQTAPQLLRFHVEADKRGQVHIQCLEGKELVASIGLSAPGINSLVNQGLMRKPASLKVGALHDWLELDGILCSFEKGHDDGSKLEQLLNARYMPAATLGQGKDVVIFANAASSTGFDIEFPVTLGGALESRRRHLAEDALEVLQDPERCGLLQPGRIVKLSRPCLVFKERTPDGGERYLEKRPEHVVMVMGDDGVDKGIDLSRPVNYMHLSAVELTAVFNHPAINRHGKLAPASTAAETDIPIIAPQSAVNTAPTPAPVLPQNVQGGLAEKQPLAVDLAKPPEVKQTAPDVHQARGYEVIAQPQEVVATPEERQPVFPNEWLKSILAQEPARHEWFASLVYTRLARKFGNSREGSLGASACWAIALGQTKHIEDPSFKGIFLTEKRGLGFLNGPHLARFNKGVAFIGTLDFAIEGIGIGLVAVGFDANQRIVFIVNDGYRAKFGLPEQTVTATLMALNEHGAIVIGVQELLQSTETLEGVWTVPAQQQNPAQPEVLENLRPLFA